MLAVELNTKAILLSNELNVKCQTFLGLENSSASPCQRTNCHFAVACRGVACLLRTSPSNSKIRGKCFFEDSAAEPNDVIKPGYCKTAGGQANFISVCLG